MSARDVQLIRESVEDYNPDKIESKFYGAAAPSILMLHGWGGDLHSLDVLGKPLSQHRLVISISLPGFGDSPEPSESWDTTGYMTILKVWLAKNGLSGLDIIAHSFGGRVAIMLASKHPELVNRLVLIASAGLRTPRSLKTRMKILLAKNLSRGARILKGKLAAYMEKRHEQLGSQDWKLASLVMRGIMVKVLEEDLSAELSEIEAPTALIWGENDTATPVYMAKTMNRLIPDSHLVVIRDAGHFCYLERKGELLSEIWKHLELPGAW